MTLLNVERIKLSSTRSPWWCAVAAVVLSVGLTALFSGFSRNAVGRNGERITVTLVDAMGPAASLGLLVIMVMAALAVTNEYRFGIIRTTFQAAPHRSAVILAKAVVLALVAAVLALLIALLVVLVARGLTGTALPVSTPGDYRKTAGLALVYAVAAVLAVAVGTLLRQSAAAIAVLLLVPAVIENLVLLIPTVGKDVQGWLPFTSANRFLVDPDPAAPLGPWASLGYFAGITAVVLAVALVVVNRRDA
jgi:ABC-2 type transport system permease protein